MHKYQKLQKLSMLKKLSLIVLVLFTVIQSRASHLKGGEITWQCMGNGSYVFTTIIYRDCNGIPGPISLQIQSDAPGNPVINCTLIQQIDLSPVGPGCPTCNNPGLEPGATEMFRFESAPTQLNGIPPALGWSFWYIDCCLNSSTIFLADQVHLLFTLKCIRITARMHFPVMIIHRF